MTLPDCKYSTLNWLKLRLKYLNLEVKLGFKLKKDIF